MIVDITYFSPASTVGLGGNKVSQDQHDTHPGEVHIFI